MHPEIGNAEPSFNESKFRHFQSGLRRADRFTFVSEDQGIASSLIDGGFVEINQKGSLGRILEGDVKVICAWKTNDKPACLGIKGDQLILSAGGSREVLNVRDPIGMYSYSPESDSGFFFRNSNYELLEFALFPSKFVSVGENQISSMQGDSSGKMLAYSQISEGKNPHASMSCDVFLYDASSRSTILLSTYTTDFFAQPCFSSSGKSILEYVHALKGRQRPSPIRILDLTGQEIGRFIFSDIVLSIDYDERNEFLAIGGVKDVILVKQVKSSPEVTTYTLGKRVVSLRINKTGNLVGGVSDDGEVFFISVL